MSQSHPKDHLMFEAIEHEAKSSSFNFRDLPLDDDFWIWMMSCKDTDVETKIISGRLTLLNEHGELMLARVGNPLGTHDTISQRVLCFKTYHLLLACGGTSKQLLKSSPVKQTQMFHFWVGVLKQHSSPAAVSDWFLTVFGPLIFALEEIIRAYDLECKDKERTNEDVEDTDSETDQPPRKKRRVDLASEGKYTNVVEFSLDLRDGRCPCWGDLTDQRYSVDPDVANPLTESWFIEKCDPLVKHSASFLGSR